MLNDYVGSERNYMQGVQKIASTYGGFFEDDLANFPAMPATSFDHEYDNELNRLRQENRELKRRLGEF